MGKKKSKKSKISKKVKDEVVTVESTQELDINNVTEVELKPKLDESKITKKTNNGKNKRKKMNKIFNNGDARENNQLLIIKPRADIEEEDIVKPNSGVEELNTESLKQKWAKLINGEISLKEGIFEESSLSQWTDILDVSANSSTSLLNTSFSTNSLFTPATFSISKVPSILQKYFIKRRKLFAKYDEGCWLDEEGWYSITPEKLAIHIAERCRANTVVDAFCGVGGNSIQLAFTCERVIAFDIDPIKLMCAKRNARIYGVEDRIEFILGDCTKYLDKLKFDAIFLSPPWGGPSYTKQKEFDLKTMMIGDIDGIELFKMCRKLTPNIAYFLPRNCILSQLRELGDAGCECEIEESYIGGHFVALTAYYGDLQRVHESNQGHTYLLHSREVIEQ